MGDLKPPVGESVRTTSSSTSQSTSMLVHRSHAHRFCPIQGCTEMLENERLAIVTHLAEKHTAQLARALNKTLLSPEAAPELGWLLRYKHWRARATAPIEAPPPTASQSTSSNSTSSNVPEDASPLVQSRIHQEDRHLACDIQGCSSVFFSPKRLSRHLANEHTALLAGAHHPARLFLPQNQAHGLCGVCTGGFATSKGLHKHLAKIHGTILSQADDHALLAAGAQQCELKRLRKRIRSPPRAPPVAGRYMCHACVPATKFRRKGALRDHTKSQHATPPTAGKSGP